MDKKDMPGIEWLTTLELRLIGIERWNAYRWRHELARKGWARHVSSVGGRGFWLFSQEAVEFLKSRKGKRGHSARETLREAE